MPVIHLPVRREHTLEPIHRTPPRVGIYVAAARARSTGPQAHVHTYVDDEAREDRRQLARALRRTACVALLAVAAAAFLQVVGGTRA